MVAGWEQARVLSFDSNRKPPLHAYEMQVLFSEARSSAQLGAGSREFWDAADFDGCFTCEESPESFTTEDAGAGAGNKKKKEKKKTGKELLDRKRKRAAAMLAQLSPVDQILLAEIKSGKLAPPSPRPKERGLPPPPPRKTPGLLPRI